MRRNQAAGAGTAVRRLTRHANGRKLLTSGLIEGAFEAGYAGSYFRIVFRIRH